MINNIKRIYKQYILPVLITFYFNIYTKPAFAADISREKVGLKGAAQYNQIMHFDEVLLGISLAVLFLLAGVIGVVISGEAGRKLSASDAKGFYHEMGNLGKILLNSMIVAVAMTILTGTILIVGILAAPDTPK